MILKSIEYLQYFPVDQYLDFIIIDAENDNLHKYVVQNVSSLFMVALEIVGSVILSPGQNSFNDFLNETNQQLTKQSLKANILIQHNPNGLI